MTPRDRTCLGWLGIVRLGLVQAALGSIVVLTTSTINRVMVVELALAATVPGVLVALHYMVQVLRPRLGYGSDVGGRRTPWIIGGMAVLAVGGFGAAVSTAWISVAPVAGIALAVLAFALIGIGVGASGTTMLVLMAKTVSAPRRAAAATITWFMMIVGFILTTAIVGHLIDPFSPERLVSVTAGVVVVAFLVTVLAVWNLEDRNCRADAQDAPSASRRREQRFRDALRQVWSEPHSRRMATFIFISMLAFSAQDLILEPFAGAVFGLTPGESTRLSSLQNGGVLAGMALVALACGSAVRGRLGGLHAWMIGGCVASALALVSLAASGFSGPAWPLRPTVFALGVANGAFAVAAIGSMMRLVGAGRESREGVRMGLWGAAQAVAFAVGGLAGTAAVDLASYAFDSKVAAYALVFIGEAALFAVAGLLAARVDREPAAVKQMGLAHAAPTGVQ
jgi:BCD family chlorophyll transporter-like MFS transporter